MKTKNYFVREFEKAMKAGEDVNVLAKNLEEIGEKARIRGAWPIWCQVCEAQMILGI